MNGTTHVHERGTWQLCHVRRLAFPLNISFYLMQHTPLWRSKFQILRIKKTRTKIGTLRISHTSSKLHQDIPSGSFTKSDLRKIGAITDKVWWLSRAYKCSPRLGFRGFAFVCICILLSLASIIKFVHDLVITILCFRPFSKHAILMSALASFRNMSLKVFSSRDVSWYFFYHFMEM